MFWEVIQGFTNKKIGDRLFISPRTVQTHLSNILSKLSLENRSQLIRYAFENGHKPPQPAQESNQSPVQEPALSDEAASATAKSSRHKQS